MLRSRWLFSFGLLLFTPLVLMLWVGSYHQIIEPYLAVGWRQAGRLPAGTTTYFDVFYITIVASIAWFIGLVKVFRLFRSAAK